MKSREQDDAKHERFGIQRKTSKENSELICWSIYH